MDSELTMRRLSLTDGRISLILRVQAPLGSPKSIKLTSPDKAKPLTETICPSGSDTPAWSDKTAFALKKQNFNYPC